MVRYNAFTGALIGVFASGGGLDGPSGLTFGPDGNLYVTDHIIGNSRVLRYNGTTGAFIDSFASFTQRDDPADLVFGPDGDLYVAGTITDKVYRFNGTTGALLGPFASGGGLDIPVGLVFTSQSAVPEPTSMTIFAAGALGLLGFVGRKRTLPAIV